MYANIHHTLNVWAIKVGGGFQNFDFHRIPGQMIQFDENIFQMGWFNHQLCKRVNNHDDRKSPNWGCGSLSKWPFHGFQIGG